MRKLLGYSIAFLVTIMTSNAQLKITAIKDELSEGQIKAFQEAAEKKKDQFIKCVERITRNKDQQIRNDIINVGLHLFEDTAHIQVSNARTNTVRSYTKDDYFRKVVASYNNPLKLITIKFTASPVYIDSILKNENGIIVGLIGHFSFTQEFWKCAIKKPAKDIELPKYERCYGDITTKTGHVIIKPINTPIGITYIVLLSGITVNETTER